MRKILETSVVILGLSVRVWAANGVADIKGTAANSTLSGTAQFEDTGAGLKISVALSGAPVGVHAFHIHEFGSCADLGKAAGSHYNPMSMPHGQVLKDGVQHAHAGDLGNVIVGADGKATLQAIIPGVTLSGAYPVSGRAVILHEKVDDFSQPVGNAGGRIACGPIVLVASTASSSFPVPVAVSPKTPVTK